MDLNALGFREVGIWGLDDRLKSGVRFNLTDCRDDRVIYGFAVDRMIKYIGICESTDTTLRHRLSRYQSMTGAGTNRRVLGLIRRELHASRSVRVLAWKPRQILKVGPLTIDLVKGLENPLIDAVKPPWNVHR